MISLRRCVVCAQLLWGRYAVDHLDEYLCVDCAGAPPCWGCGAATGGQGVRARTVLSEGRARCTRCSRSGVDSPADARPTIAAVRSLMHGYGVRLLNRVRVELRAPAALGADGHESLLGLTYVVRGHAVLSLHVADGLPATRFGAVLAHEMGHAWLAGCPDANRTPLEEEGICELLACWWLEHRGGRLSRHLLSSMAKNPHPVYGAGLRLARDASAGLTPRAVVERVSRLGTIRGQ